MTHKAQGFTLDDYPNIRRWYADVRARPQVQAGLAIGKFVKEPFDEAARKNMFGQAAEGAEVLNLAPLAGRGRPAKRKRRRAGEGDSPRVVPVERAPHPNPLPAKAGRGSRKGKAV